MASSTFRHLESGDELTDLVTGLAKAHVEMEHARYAFDRARQSGTLVGVVVVDIDDFGRLDEAHGWGTGDEVLRQVAQRIGSVLREDDRATRLSGDVFAAICEGLEEPGGVASVEERIRAVLEPPFVVGELEVALRVSTGTAVSTGEGTPEALAVEAEVAMQQRRRRRPGRTAAGPSQDDPEPPTRPATGGTSAD